MSITIVNAMSECIEVPRGAGFDERNKFKSFPLTAFPGPMRFPASRPPVPTQKTDFHRPGSFGKLELVWN